ncbi:PP2C family serine/threonine-protein phosphatase [Deinococcus sp.]|uniref:PP2C family protein-serine/threonine phosphatase n=1 Tax=Deinococcus sp. TaxID=47478 RepID=UPI0025C176FD|nr:PP2C family serine/threonine-protein phosphatase [Deinococcus sp.]
MQSAAPALIASGILTAVGRQRMGGVNQDAAIALELPNGGLYGVADGMGGHAAGELAANLALTTLTQAYLEGRGTPPKRLTEAVQAANLAVLKHAVGESVGMGTTLVAALIDRGALILAHVGDSRAYLLRDGQLQRLTNDHSWVAEQVRLGLLTEAEAQNHQWKSVVNNALGGEERVRLELFGMPIRAGDRLLLCSDGLSGPVPDAQLQELLSRQQSPEQLTRLLIDAANDAGGPDNITAVIVDIKRNQAPPRYPLPRRSTDGPEYADLLLSNQRGSSVMSYMMLTAVYFILLSIILAPDHRTLLGIVGLLVLMGLLLGQRYLQTRHVERRSRLSLTAVRRAGAYEDGQSGADSRR